MKNSLTLLLLLVTNVVFATSGNDVNTDEIAFADEMTQQALDFHALLDQNSDSDGKSVMANTAARLDEKAADKDLAKIVVIVNRAPKGAATDAQRAKVYIDGRLEKTFIVSTGKVGHESRVGYYRPVYTNHLRFYHEYYSGKYGSRMARAIFYSGGYAIHHSDALKKLGSRASHGCVRFKIEDIDWINSYAKVLGNQNYVMRKWSHGHHPTWKKNIHYKGLARKVTPINARTGKMVKSASVNSLDMVILVKDQRDSDA